MIRLLAIKRLNVRRISRILRTFGRSGDQSIGRTNSDSNGRTDQEN